MFCPVKAIGKTVATERRMERDMKYITKNLDFQLDKRSVVTLGKFDGVHKGHSKLINRVLEIGKEGYETVVFTFDVSPLVRLGTRIKRTILTNEERRILLERRGVDCLVECPFVPEIIRMEPEDFIREILVKQLRAAYVVVGPDFHGSMITHTIRFLRGGLRTIRFSSDGGFACHPQRLHPSTGTSVAPRWFHCSVSTSPHAAVTEY